MNDIDPTDVDPTTDDVAGKTGDVSRSGPPLQGSAGADLPDSWAGGFSPGAADSSDGDDAGVAVSDDLGVGAFSPAPDMDHAYDAFDGPNPDEVRAFDAAPADAAVGERAAPGFEPAPAVDSDDLGPLVFDSDAEKLGPLGDEGTLNDPSPVGPYFTPLERLQGIVADGIVEVELQQIEITAHAHEIAMLHGEYDPAHAEAEYAAQQSLEPTIDSPTWLSADELANRESELRQDVAEEMDRRAPDIEHEAEEQRVQASLIKPDVAAHMRELVELDQDTNVAHAAAEVETQQSRSVEEYEIPSSSDTGHVETGHDWGIRIVFGASTPGPGANTDPLGPGFSGESIKLEIKNLATGEVGVFNGLGLGAGWSTPSIDLGASEDWIVFRTADSHTLQDFAGRASLSDVSIPFGTLHSTIRFADPDAWLPWAGDIDVEHDSVAQAVWFGDGVDITQATQHIGGGVSASLVVLELETTWFEEPSPDLGDVVRDGMRGEDSEVGP